MEDFFPVSVWYGEGKARAPMTPRSTEKSRELASRDLEKIRELGFNSIRYWIDWAAIEPKPNTWVLDHLDHLMDEAERNGLKVIIQLYLESAPNWLGIAYPDARYKAQSGDVIESQSSPGYSLDHPAVRQEAEKLMRKLAAHVKNHPAFYGWDVWSEPHIIQWTWLDWLPRAVGWFDYSGYSQERFRQWLKKRYGQIERLNEAWYRTYQSWSEVTPPKYVTLSTWRDLIDWQRFNIHKLAEDLRWKVCTIREVDNDHVISSHSAITSVFTMPLGWYGNPDDWKMAEEVDVWGTSMYPKHIGEEMPLDPVQRVVALDATRSSSQSRNKHFWIGELQGGSGTTGIKFGEPVTPQDVQLWAWTAISRGAKGLNYYAWYPMDSGYEIGGFGLANLDGSVSDRAKSAGKVSRIISENMDLFREATPVKAEVGIVYNIYTRMMLTASRERSAKICRDSMTGIYRAFFEESIPVDFIHIDDFAERNLNNYKLIFLPFSIMMNADIAEGIKEYVRNGGKLVAEVRPGWSNDKGQCSKLIPGLGLHEVFGCREQQIREDEKPLVSIIENNVALKTFSPDDKLIGLKFEEALDVSSDGGTVLAKFSDDSPAIVVNNYGAGEAMLIGTLLGAGYENFRIPKTGEFLKSLMGWAKVSPSLKLIAKTDEDLEICQLEGKHYKLFFLFNHSTSTVKPDISMKSSKGEFKAYELISEKAFQCGPHDGKLVIQITEELKPGETMVIKLTKTSQNIKGGGNTP